MKTRKGIVYRASEKVQQMYTRNTDANNVKNQPC